MQNHLNEKGKLKKKKAQRLDSFTNLNFNYEHLSVLEDS